jgi:hypothetical protein
MLMNSLRRFVRIHRDLILQEGRQINGFLKLLMKQRNTGVKWTKSEKAELRSYLKHLSAYVPVMIIFLLPFGSFLIPILAEILDRRKTIRGSQAQPILGKEQVS